MFLITATLGQREADENGAQMSHSEAPGFQQPCISLCWIPSSTNWTDDSRESQQNLHGHVQQCLDVKKMELNMHGRMAAENSPSPCWRRDGAF